MHRAFFFCIVLLLFSITLFVQQPLIPQEAESERAMAEQRIKKMQEERVKHQRERLEMLKERAPELYRVEKASFERQEKINEITSDFSAKNISEQTAKKRLFPLLEKELKATIENLPNRIKRLEKQLEFLKKARKHPKLLIEKQITVMLGLEQVSPEDIYLCFAK